MELLIGMYPDEILNHLRTSFQQKQRAIYQPGGVLNATQLMDPQDRGEVTVLFCEICEFNLLLAKLQPHKFVQMLDSLFRMMSRFCHESNVMKIETVGPIFMAAGLASTSNPPGATVQEDALNTLIAALNILTVASRNKVATAEINDCIRVKLGLNSGPVITGIVGCQKPQFVLFGDTVNTASRMQSLCTVDHVHVSASTYEHVKSDGRFKWREQTVQVKGKGTMSTYLLANEYSKSAISGKAGRKLSFHGMMLQKHELDAFELGPSPNSSQSFTQHAAAAQAAAKSVLSLLPESHRPKVEMLFRDLWSVCVDLCTAEDASEYAQIGILLASMSMFWICYNLECLCIMHGYQGQSAHRWDLFLALRGGYSALFFLVLIVSAALAHEHFKDPQQEAQDDILGISSSSDITETEPSHERIEYLRAEFEKQLLEQTNMMVAGKSVNHDGTSARTAKERSLTTMLFVTCSALSLAGYAFSVLSNLMGLVDQSEYHKVIFLIYFESLLFLAAILHLCVVWSDPRPLLAGFVILLAAVLFAAVELSDYSQGAMAIYPLTLAVVQLRVRYYMQAYRRKSNASLAQIKKEHADCCLLLDSILPPQVLRGLHMQKISSTHALVHEYDNMTLLFADMVGFTSYCATHKASEAMMLVTHLFAKFDDYVKILGLYKVCTIGDAYVAVNEPKNFHKDKEAGAVRMMLLAKAMLKSISEVRSQVNDPSLDMRIGGHHGSFLAGIIGNDQLRFDVWGEDVMISNKMESKGKPGHVCVSKELVDCLTRFPQFHFDFYKNVEATATRTVEAYMLANASGSV
eukprot:CAMPEP_0197700168 /NCGR_PEP_ID=MMETSP1338-20131121/121605_1 /TAXON_ID=43686 ORGANISM="Pelagodinium beii, Strain RCC1491" /NCGR_SAMPLE_ID=MMETSP1338 /ASSEMBLY_ACC=CAM_ASM_000754 /LENGTH=803 /DNA_ID=CAMNT_0043283741 /DNA_START=102 /DNA_END=2513 /DNA_ORIENTATION=+